MTAGRCPHVAAGQAGIDRVEIHSRYELRRRLEHWNLKLPEDDDSWRRTKRSSEGTPSPKCTFTLPGRTEVEITLSTKAVMTAIKLNGFRLLHLYWQKRGVDLIPDRRPLDYEPRSRGGDKRHDNFLDPAKVKAAEASGLTLGKILMPVTRLIEETYYAALSVRTAKLKAFGITDAMYSFARHYFRRVEVATDVEFDPLVVLDVLDLNGNPVHFDDALRRHLPQALAAGVGQLTSESAYTKGRRKGRSWCVGAEAVWGGFSCYDKVEVEADGVMPPKRTQRFESRYGKDHGTKPFAVAGGALIDGDLIAKLDKLIIHHTKTTNAVLEALPLYYPPDLLNRVFVLSIAGNALTLGRLVAEQGCIMPDQLRELYTEGQRGKLIANGILKHDAKRGVYVVGAAVIARADALIAGEEKIPMIAPPVRGVYVGLEQPRRARRSSAAPRLESYKLSPHRVRRGCSCYRSRGAASTRCPTRTSPRSTSSSPPWTSR